MNDPADGAWKTGQTDHGWTIKPVDDDPTSEPSTTPDPSRDERGRFRPGYSGNSKGPPVKKVRSLTQRQLREDVLRVYDKLVESDGGKIPFGMSLMQSILNNARNTSDLKSQIRVLELLSVLLVDHERGVEDAETLRQAEKQTGPRTRGDRRMIEREMNKLRKATWLKK